MISNSLSLARNNYSAQMGSQRVANKGNQKLGFAANPSEIESIVNVTKAYMGTAIQKLLVEVLGSNEALVKIRPGTIDKYTKECLHGVALGLDNSPKSIEPHVLADAFRTIDRKAIK